MKRPSISVAALLGAVCIMAAWSGAASADGPPRYDVKAHCDAVASATGASSEMIRQGCFQQEQQSYNRIKQLWGELPSATQQHCDQVARAASSGSYMILSGCIDQELASRGANDNFEFDY